MVFSESSGEVKARPRDGGIENGDLALFNVK